MSHKFVTILACGSMALAACTPTPPVNNTEDKNNDKNMEHSMDEKMETAALKDGCDSLKGKSVTEKAKLLEEIAHNMDKNALDYILGKKCAFLGSLAKLTNSLDADLRLMSDDQETLYYAPETRQFFLAYGSANTVGYVVSHNDNALTPDLFFNQKREEFEKAADAAREMMNSPRSPQADDDHDMDMEDEEDTDDSAMVPMAYAAEYTDYTEGVIGNGEESVLFFKAEWCPKCKVNDEKISGWFAADALRRNIYKIDYDTAEELKTQFGIVSQDTFVLIDGEGVAQDSVTFPTEAQLKALVGW